MQIMSSVVSFRVGKDDGWKEKNGKKKKSLEGGIRAYLW